LFLVRAHGCTFSGDRAIYARTGKTVGSEAAVVAALDEVAGRSVG